MTEETNGDFEALLTFLRDSRGFDFTGYKRSSLMRRVTKRMEIVGIKGFTEYLDFLQVHPDEFVQLFNYILINVTGFFRDPQIWDVVSEHVVPRIVEEHGTDRPIRVWDAGCASGEETYSIAMVLAEALGQGAFRDRVKLYATDVDEEALTKARQAAYTDKEVQPVPPPLLERYFERNGQSYSFDRELRRSITFGRHDLVQDAPISRVDLLVCRNTLMYFNAETQSKVMNHFHFALNEGGVLVLGRAEMLFSGTGSFFPLDLKHRLFTKVLGTDTFKDRVALAQGANAETFSQFGDHIAMRDAAFDSGAAAQVLIDRNGFITRANHRARAMFGLAASDIGRRLQDLELSYRPVELRSMIDQANSANDPASLAAVGWRDREGNEVTLDIQVVPLREDGRALGVTVLFTDVSQFTQLQDELERSNQELETAMEELQSTNEELETTNEELQSTNEELETTNEELRSTNEELETMNEELQSTNEELHAINDEVRVRNEEVAQLNSLLSSILGGIQGGVVVVDRNMNVLEWSERAQEMWGLRSDEVKGQTLFGLDFGLSVADLAGPIREMANGGRDGHVVELSAINRRGQAITARVQISPLRGPRGSAEGAILLIEEVRGDGA